jgi:hypothetical protein
MNCVVTAWGWSADTEKKRLDDAASEPASATGFRVAMKDIRRKLLASNSDWEDRIQVLTFLLAATLLTTITTTTIVTTFAS